MSTTATSTPRLRSPHLLKEIDLSPDEFIGLLDLASALKQAKAAGTEIRHLQDKNIALIFEKASTRTHCAFEVAAYDQGAQTTYLGPCPTTRPSATHGGSQPRPVPASRSPTTSRRLRSASTSCTPTSG
jgi:hypothetical protein